MPKKKSPTDEVPKPLKPYLFHGVDLDWKNKEQASGDCPFCGKENKFSVNSRTGQWDCKVCSTSGNCSVFLRQLWLKGSEVTSYQDYESLAKDRGLLYPDSLTRWEVVKSPLRNNWLVPAYNTSGNINQLYRYVQINGKMRLLATPEMKHQLFGHFIEKRSEVYLCEGPWDAIALSEVLGRAKNEDVEDLTSSFIPTSSFVESWMSDASVLAVPGTNGFPKSWVDSFGGKFVKILFDNDHPREQQNSTVAGAGYLGAQSLANRLASSKTPPASIEFLQWGEDGYDKALPNGYDVRDFLSA